MKKDNSKGLWIERVIWDRTDLNITEKCLLAKIDDLDNGRGCFASNAYLGTYMQLSPKSISQLIGRLIKKGYIQFIVSDGRKRFLRVRQIEDTDGNKSSSQNSQESAASIEDAPDYINSIDKKETKSPYNIPSPKGEEDVLGLGGESENAGELTSNKDSIYSELDGGYIGVGYVIDEVFDAFQEINPAIKFLRKRPEQRKAILDLLDGQGYDGLMELIGLVVSGKISYAPTITNPQQLLMKEAEFFIACGRNNYHDFKYAYDPTLSDDDRHWIDYVNSEEFEKDQEKIHEELKNNPIK